MAEDIAQQRHDRARRVLNLMIGGKDVPMSVQQAAVNVLRGVGGSSDDAAVSAWLKSQRTTAGGLKRTARSIRDWTTPIFDATREAQLLSQAQSGGELLAAGTRLAAVGGDTLEKVLASKAGRGLIGKVAELVGSNPSMALEAVRGLSRGIRWANMAFRATGAAAAVVQTGFEAAQEWMDQQGGAAKAKAARSNLSAQVGVDPRTLRVLFELAEQQVKSERGGWRRAMDWLGFTQTTEDEITRRGLGTIQRRNRQRQLARQFGVNELDVLQREAAARGVGVHELTDRQRAEALDRALPTLADRAGLTEYNRQQDQRRTWNESLWEWLFADSRQATLGKRREEYEQRRLLTMQRRKEEAEWWEADAWNRLSPAERLRRTEEQQMVRAAARNFQARHAVRIED